MGQKIRLSETQLKKIITESVKKTINELFDTLPGIKKGSDIAIRGNKAGRYGQGGKVIDAVKNSLKERFDGKLRAYTSTFIVFKSVADTCVCIDKDGEIFYVDEDECLTPNKVKFGTLDTKTDDRSLARVIAKWCNDHVSPAIEEYSDWHNWACL